MQDVLQYRVLLIFNVAININKTLQPMKICFVPAFLWYFKVFADLPAAQVNTDISALMDGKRYDDVEKYIETNKIDTLKTNLLFKGLLSTRRGEFKEAIVFFEMHIEGATNREIAFGDVIRAGGDSVEVVRHMRQVGVGRFGLRLPTSVEVETQLQAILSGDNLEQMIVGLNSKRALIALASETAYNEIRMASFRHMGLASKPMDSPSKSKEVKDRHGQIGEALYRYLEQVDGSIYASIAGQTQLAAILQERHAYGPALQILTALRELKGPELDIHMGRIEFIMAVCLEGSGMKDRANQLYRKIVDNRGDLNYSTYASFADLKLANMAVIAMSAPPEGNAKRGGAYFLFGCSALVAFGLMLLTMFMRRRRISASVVLLLIAFINLYGVAVVNADDAESSNAKSAGVGFNLTTNRLDLGLLKGKSVKFEWNPKLKDQDTVTRLSASCGCTVVGLKEGDRLTSHQGIPLDISLSGKLAGRHEESVLLELASGRSLILQFAFEYQPAPIVPTEYVLFWPGAYTRTLMVRTFGQQRVEFRNLSTNGPVSVRKKRNTEAGIEIELSLDPASKWPVRDGFVKLEVNTGDRYTNSIPFALLTAAP